MSDFNNNRQTGYKVTVKTAIQVFVGLIYIGIALYLFIKHRFGAVELGAGTSYGLGALLIVYGAFRIWRAVQDMKTDGDY